MKIIISLIVLRFLFLFINFSKINKYKYRNKENKIHDKISCFYLTMFMFEIVFIIEFFEGIVNVLELFSRFIENKIAILTGITYKILFKGE